MCVLVINCLTRKSRESGWDCVCACVCVCVLCVRPVSSVCVRRRFIGSDVLDNKVVGLNHHQHTLPRLRLLCARLPKSSLHQLWPTQLIPVHVGTHRRTCCRCLRVSDARYAFPGPMSAFSRWRVRQTRVPDLNDALAINSRSITQLHYNVVIYKSHKIHTHTLCAILHIKGVCAFVSMWSRGVCAWRVRVCVDVDTFITPHAVICVCTVCVCTLDGKASARKR